MTYRGIRSTIIRPIRSSVWSIVTRESFNPQTSQLLGAVKTCRVDGTVAAFELACRGVAGSSVLLGTAAGVDLPMTQPQSKGTFAHFGDGRVGGKGGVA